MKRLYAYVDGERGRVVINTAPMPDAVGIECVLNANREDLESGLFLSTFVVEAGDYREGLPVDSQVTALLDAALEDIALTVLSGEVVVYPFTWQADDATEAE